MLVIALTHWLQPQISVLPNAQHEDERFLVQSTRLLDGSLELPLDHTCNPRPTSLSCLVYVESSAYWIVSTLAYEKSLINEMEELKRFQGYTFDTFARRKLIEDRDTVIEESHPHPRALQAERKQDNTYNPFSEESKVMIRDMGNVELFVQCETISKVQCSECLLFWNQGIVYCTCGHHSKQSEASQNFHQWRLDAFSIGNYVMKKVRPRSVRRQNSSTERNSQSLPYKTQHIVIRS